MTDDPAISQRRIPLDRISVLIDSIYAFAMTLLVITINIPSKYEHAKEAAPVFAIIMADLPDLIHYFIAFILLAILWYFEHQRFRSLIGLDRPLLCFNMASLAFVCLLPFSTNVAGDYPFDHVGAILFEFNIFIIGVIALIQWVYIQKRCRNLVPGLSLSQISREILWSAVFPALSFIGIILALCHVPFTLGIYILVPFIMAFLFWEEPVRN
jgi:uncharacterized membrane protein